MLLTCQCRGTKILNKAGGKPTVCPFCAPKCGPCRPAFSSEKEMRETFDALREDTKDDLKELAQARRFIPDIRLG